jgi:hypothetical protein
VSKCLNHKIPILPNNIIHKGHLLVKYSTTSTLAAGVVEVCVDATTGRKQHGPRRGSGLSTAAAAKEASTRHDDSRATASELGEEPRRNMHGSGLPMIELENEVANERPGRHGQDSAAGVLDAVTRRSWVGEPEGEGG